MATSGQVINSECSPINIVEENLEESHVKLNDRKKKYKEAQKMKSPFLIGSIEEVNKKVSRLDRKLQQYTALIVESRSTDKTEESIDYTYFMHQHDEELARDYEKRLKEAQEVNQFAGIYSIKSRDKIKVVDPWDRSKLYKKAFLSKASDRVKHIQKISVSGNKPAVPVSKVEKGKPKFVELHQYPGYFPNALTPLPHGVTASDILSKVAEAQPKLKKTPLYRPEFERLFYSQMSQAILQDTFWWLFLDKWQSRDRFQQELFNRVAHNYVKLITYAKHPQYRDTFLKDYPSFLAQAVYAAFCATFPDSYRQFDDNFKEDLVGLVYQWVAGMRPAPRTWAKWNMDKLEPANIKMREELLRQAQERKNKINSSIIDFSFLEQPPSVITGSQSTLNQVGSVSSFTSATGRRLKNKRSVTYHHSTNLGKTASNTSQKHEKKEQSPNPKVTESAIQEVAQAQSGSPENQPATASDSKGSLRGKKSKSMLVGLMEEEGGDRKEQLTPIRELDQENSSYGENKFSKAGSGANYSKTSLMHKHRYEPRESHPACKGPDFVRSAFNTYGQSPLVAQFLRMKHLQPEAGILTRVQRTELENLPPVHHQTYRDVMTKAYKRVREVEMDYSRHCQNEKKERRNFVMKQKAVLNEYMKKEGALLSQKREVKRLSDLIMLELKKDKDSVSAGAALALEAALLAQ